MELTYQKTGALIKQKFKDFFVPTVLSSMAAQLGTIVNGIIVGNLISPHAMAAVSVCVPLNQVNYALAVLISIGASGLIAIAAGKRDNDGADYIFTTVVTVSIFVGMLWTVFLVPNTYAVAMFLSSAEDLRGLVHEYMPLYLMFFSWQTLIRTDGFAKIVSRGILLGQVTNVVLSFALVASGFGVAGAAIALISGDIIAMSYIAKKYFSSSERSRKFCAVFKDFGRLIKQVGGILKSGIPVASGTALISVKVWAIYQILGQTGGADAMTLYAICMACLSVMSMCIAGCNGAMMPIIGMLYGEKDFSGVRILIKYVLRFALTLSGIFVAFAVLFPQIILSIYNVPAALIESGKIALRLFSISLAGVTVTFLAMYYSSTIQRRTAANILSWTEGIIDVVPAAWLLSKTFGLNGIWFAFILAEVAGFAMIFVYTKIVCKNSGGKLNDVFLIEKTEPNILYDVSFKADADNAVKLYSEAVNVLKNDNVADNVYLKVAVALEEMAVHLAKINAGKVVDADVRIKSAADKIIIAFRDNGKPFNPTEYHPNEAAYFDNIAMLKALSKNISYNRVLSLNQTIIEI